MDNSEIPTATQDNPDEWTPDHKYHPEHGVTKETHVRGSGSALWSLGYPHQPQALGSDGGVATARAQEPGTDPGWKSREVTK